MMPQYGAAVIRERAGLRSDRELSQYVTWEYGEGTTIASLRGGVVVRRPSRRTTRFGLIDRLRGLTSTIKVRVASRLMDEWERELALLAQWKRGELRTSELVNRLEELEPKATISSASPSP
jgi:hypothetical protein